MQVVLKSAEGEITEKKSRFIGHVHEVHSEEEAFGIIEAYKKKYWDAKHNAYAYVLGSANEISRFSDDKEPQGTAGKPILDCLLNNDFKNTLIVVTRYFGGVLLGTGGLVRAYTDAALKALSNASVFTLHQGTLCTLSIDYSFLGKIQYILQQMDIAIKQTDYGEKITFTLIIESGTKKAFTEKITEVLSGTSEINLLEDVYFVKDKEAVIYNL